MRDLFGLLDSAIYRLLTTRLIPGLIALSPFLFLVVKSYPDIAIHWTDFRLELSLIVALLASAVGVLIEDLGLHVENIHFKVLKGETLKSADCRDLTEEWYKYLRTSFEKEPVGVGYVREVVLMLKFEINMAIALIIASLGVLMLEFSLCAKVCIAFILWLLAYALGIRIAKGSVDHLAQLRFELLKGARNGAETKE